MHIWSLILYINYLQCKISSSVGNQANNKKKSKNMASNIDKIFKVNIENLDVLKFIYYR